MPSSVSGVHVVHTPTGKARYAIDIDNAYLGKVRRCTGTDRDLLYLMAERQRLEWDKTEAERRGREEAALARAEQAKHRLREKADEAAYAEERRLEALQLSADAQAALDQLRSLLRCALNRDPSFDWDLLKDHSPSAEPPPTPPAPPRRPAEPRPPAPPAPPADEPLPTAPIPGKEPDRASAVFLPKLSLVERLLPKRRAQVEQQAQARFELAHRRWSEACQAGATRYEAACRDRDQRARAAAALHAESLDAHRRVLHRLSKQHEQDLARYEVLVAETQSEHAAAVARWHERNAEHASRQTDGNLAVDRRRAQYIQGEPEAVVEYCEHVLSASPYPECFPKSMELTFAPETGTLVADYWLPEPASLPTLTEVTYIKTKDDLKAKHITDRQRDSLYDSVVYQVVLRTLHELFAADTPGHLMAVSVNGIVHALNAATGHEQDSCIVSIHVTREAFCAVNLSQVEPKDCFRQLRGVGSSELHSVTAVQPIMTIDRDDRRFVESYGVAASLYQGTNLASMDWEDFEHLIRELFEQEFAQGGGEVHVTRASHDGGVDAVVFDPDPIRGGKIVIQAKRYTNAVGVAAVRDLYGTLQHEGANKGILVTTSDYGPDAHEFARGKPITLLNGGNLLHLLEKHGHQAHIDIKSARTAMAEAQRHD